MPLPERERAFIAELVRTFPGSTWVGPDPLRGHHHDPAQGDLFAQATEREPAETTHADWQHKPELPSVARAYLDKLRGDGYARDQDV